MNPAPPPAPLRSILALVGFIAASFTAGAIGSWATFPHVRSWYPLLNKPDWNPPGWVFGPVWTILYVLMGVAIWRAWRAGGPAVRGLVAGYFVQLGLNALWPVLFFGLRQPAWALLEILVLWGFLVWLQAGLWRAEKAAGALWLPYVLWVTFATVLNTAIVRLN
ncbi:MAG: tryptophan-rich sensory protein [Lacunisphaera sp.]|nr:tryptophan-rich sensory protein [Lacunisphaera sp.]